MPLTSNGENQARALRPLLENIAPDISLVMCSDLKRAVRTAELALPGREILTSAAFREISFGKWEGRTYDEIKSEPEFAQYAQGGSAPGGESAADFSARITEALDSLISGYDGTCAIVAHSGSIRHIIAHMLCLESDANWRFSMDMASVSILTVSSGYAYLSALNIRPGM